MNTKIKLTKDQIRGLALLVEKGLEIMPVNNMADKLVYRLMEKLSERLEKKADKVIESAKQPKSFTMNEIESLTFYTWYHQMYAYMANDYYYETLIGKKIFNQIDKEYA